MPIGRPLYRSPLTGKFVRSGEAGVLGENLSAEGLQAGMEKPVGLDSSWLEWASYSPFNQTMIINFKPGISFAYYNVPPSLFDGLIAASSPGKYFHKYIMHLYSAHRI